MQYGVNLRQRYGETAKAYELARLSSFFHQLRAFHSSLDVLVHIQPALAAPLWGSIRLCVDVCRDARIVKSYMLT
jgi:hypothetical protein